MYSPLVTVSSPLKERFGIRVLFVLGGNHFCLIFVVRRKKTPADELGFCDMMWKRNTTRWEGDRDGEHMQIHGWFISMYDKTHYNIVISLQLIKKKRGTWQKLAATMEPVWDGVSRPISLLPRGVSGGLHGTQACGAASWWWGALLSAEHPLLCLGHHPSSLPYILTLVGTELAGDQLTGKRRQRAQPRGRLCMRHHPALPPDRLSVEITVGHAHIRSSQRNSPISLETFWEDPVFFQTILSK